MKASKAAITSKHLSDGTQDSLLFYKVMAWSVFTVKKPFFYVVNINVSLFLLVIIIICYYSFLPEHKKNSNKKIKCRQNKKALS